MKTRFQSSNESQQRPFACCFHCHCCPPTISRSRRQPANQVPRAEILKSVLWIPNQVLSVLQYRNCFQRVRRSHACFLLPRPRRSCSSPAQARLRVLRAAFAPLPPSQRQGCESRRTWTGKGYCRWGRAGHCQRSLHRHRHAARRGARIATPQGRHCVLGRA
jgi:hypothetical protein